ncbi:MAG: DUF4349 domain-containing protein [Oleispira antarctica]|uniref:DUF4349 domain-containing protein n=1 Tax=Oleispira antarctica RB-8 TaxID=698738 RepID=R4YV89_OLEAN|nr:DUF4349 domain-containing protein [Oleispira antarctica]MBQ0793210.1 DUF4349 domain-containing protein [Oleispira antarctica]CCK77779.1 hypothetical protein OLEAN_C36030 [Oleispira antarctica RB-8]
MNDLINKMIQAQLMQRLLILLAISFGMTLTGCALNHGYSDMNEGLRGLAMESSPASMSSAKISNNADSQDRKLIKRSWLNIGVKDLAKAEADAKAIVEQKTGYIENTNDEQGKSFNLSIRIPQDQYATALVELREVGAVISENENVQDVTTEFIDNKARLDNLYKLRNRIQLLLDRADVIEDLLKIERELNRTQSEIDRLEGRMKYLKGQVDYASIEFSAKKQKTYGPLGYFFMGIWWGVEKLFVWDQ